VEISEARGSSGPCSSLNPNVKIYTRSLRVRRIPAIETMQDILPGRSKLIDTLLITSIPEQRSFCGDSAWDCAILKLMARKHRLQRDFSPSHANNNPIPDGQWRKMLSFSINKSVLSPSSVRVSPFLTATDYRRKWDRNGKGSDPARVPRCTSL
jgi:hypothetical protein